MRLHALRQFALSLPQTTVVKQWGEHLVFKVAAKMFLIVGLDGETIDGVTFKCAPSHEFDQLTDIDGITQAPYCAKRHWVRVADLSVLPAAELDRLVRHSYDLVVAGLPKKVQASLGVVAVTAGTQNARPMPRERTSAKAKSKTLAKGELATKAKAPTRTAVAAKAKAPRRPSRTSQ